MAEALVTSAKAGWVGAGKPNATHYSGRRLRVSLDQHMAFVHLKSPVPPGDTVSTAPLRLVVAEAAVGTFTLTARRVSSRVDWSDLTWNNAPGVTGTSATAVLTDPQPGDVFEFAVADHMQTIADGAKNFGWRLTSDNAAILKLHGAESADSPTLEVTYAGTPGTPTDLVPDGVVSLAAPFLSLSAPDVTGDDAVSAVQVQIDSAPVVAADGSWTTPDFDSGEVATTVPELDLAGTAYVGLAAAATTQWHVRWKSTSGVWSNWSDAATLTRTAKGAISITNPASGAVLEPTPPLIATFAGTVESYRIRVLNADGEVVDTSRRLPATDPTTISWTPETSLEDGVTYTAEFRVWDDADRVASPGDPVWTQATATFTVDEDALVTAPTISGVAEDATLPLLTVTWTIATAPDAFIVHRDGKPVAVDLAPADYLVSGTTYAWTDPDASPHVEHSYTVRAVVNGSRGPKSAAATGTLVPKGLWLIRQDQTRWCRFRGDDIDNWSVEDQEGIFRVHGRSNLVRIRAAIGSLGGSFPGEIDTVGRDLADSVADLRAMNEVGDPVTLVCADYAHLVTLRNVTIAPHRHTREGRVFQRASFQFIEA